MVVHVIVVSYLSVCNEPAAAEIHTNLHALSLHDALPSCQVAGVFGGQRSGEARAYVGRTGVELAGERARIVTVARQRGFEVVNRPRPHLLDDIRSDGIGSEAEAPLEGACQVHLDLTRRAQALGDEGARVLVHLFGNLAPPRSPRP